MNSIKVGPLTVKSLLPMVRKLERHEIVKVIREFWDSVRTPATEAVSLQGFAMQLDQRSWDTQAIVDRMRRQYQVPPMSFTGTVALGIGPWHPITTTAATIADSAVTDAWTTSGVSL